MRWEIEARDPERQRPSMPTCPLEDRGRRRYRPSPPASAGPNAARGGHIRSGKRSDVALEVQVADPPTSLAKTVASFTTRSPHRSGTRRRAWPREEQPLEYEKSSTPLDGSPEDDWFPTWSTEPKYEMGETVMGTLVSLRVRRHMTTD